VAVRAGGKELMAAEPFTLSRIYSFDETRLLAKEREKDILREALARDMAGVVMRRLSAL
jgi:outer membrane lipopolysaccharide assembly protein LptE/RlpB